MRDYDSNLAGTGYKFSFSWSGSRNDPDKAKQFSSFAEAARIVHLMPEKLQGQVDIRKSPYWVITTDH